MYSYSNTPLNGLAGGNISKSRFIKLDGTTSNTFVQADDATDVILGVATEAAKEWPDSDIATSELAAEDGDQFQWYGYGAEAPIAAEGTSGQAFVSGSEVTSDANGRAVLATTGDKVVAICFEVRTTTADDEIIQCLLIAPYIKPA